MIDQNCPTTIKMKPAMSEIHLTRFSPTRFLALFMRHTVVISKCHIGSLLHVFLPSSSMQHSISSARSLDLDVAAENMIVADGST